MYTTTLVVVAALTAAPSPVDPAEANGAGEQQRRWAIVRVSKTGYGRTDQQGRFVIESLPPGEFVLRTALPSGDRPRGRRAPPDHATPAAVAPGQTVRVTIRREGVILTGHLLPPPKLDLAANAPVAGMLMGRTSEALAALTDSDRHRRYQFDVKADGRFVIDDVAPGAYRLSVTAGDFGLYEVREDGQAAGITIGPLSEAKDGRLDLGDLQLGRPAPVRPKQRGVVRDSQSARTPGRPSPIVAVVAIGVLAVVLIAYRMSAFRRPSS